MLDQVIHMHGEEKVWISYAMNEFVDVGGSAVWMQKATTKKPEHWQVWYTPNHRKHFILRTPPEEWQDWGIYNWHTCTPVWQPKAKAKAIKDKGSKGHSTSTTKLILQLKGGEHKVKAEATAKTEAEAEAEAQANPAA